MVAITETRAYGAAAAGGAEYTANGRSAASWGAIIAGAFVATASSLILLSLGAGVGLASISPWDGHGISGSTFTVATAIWFVVTQWLSALLGGYIAGRLRTRWTGTHAHEVFFRDTAHGLVTWAVSTVLIAATLAGAASALVGGGLHAAGNVALASAQGISAGASAGAGAPTAANTASYAIDKLFRSTPDAVPSTGDPRAEVLRIVVNGVSNGGLASDDRVYLATLVAQKTGASQSEAQKRVDDFAASVQEAEAKAKAAADAARKSAAKTAIYTALSMLIGAFIASVAAALGGRLRDEHP